MKDPLTNRSADFLLNLRKFKIFKFKAVTDVNAKGQQSNSDLRDHTSLVIFDESIVATNINNSTEHIDSP